MRFKMNKEQMYEDMQMRLERNESSISGKYVKMNRFIKDCIEHSDRKLSAEQMRRQQRRAKVYKRVELTAEEFEGVNP